MALKAFFRSKSYIFGVWLANQTGIRGLFRQEIGGAKALTQEPRSTKKEKKNPGAPVRSAFNITCFAGSATFREILIHFKVNMYFTLIKKEISIKKRFV